MTDRPKTEFGKRRRVVPLAPPPPAKRSNHVALLLMGTMAVGASAYALMPSERCQPASPGMAASAECPPRGSSSSGGHGGGGSSRSSFYSGSSASGQSAAGTSDSGSGRVSRGGFGSFAHAFGFGGG